MVKSVFRCKSNFFSFGSKVSLIVEVSVVVVTLLFVVVSLFVIVPVGLRHVVQTPSSLWVPSVSLLSPQTSVPGPPLTVTEQESEVVNGR